MATDTRARFQDGYAVVSADGVGTYLKRDVAHDAQMMKSRGACLYLRRCQPHALSTVPVY